MVDNLMQSKKFGQMLQIDVLNLEKEWLNQAGLYMYWAEKAANARASYDKARYQQDKTEAEVATDVRLDPTKYGLDKVTETSISNAVKLSSAYEEASLARIEAYRRAEVLSKTVVALEQRKKALENLAYMASAGLNAQPTEKRRK